MKVSVIIPMFNGERFIRAAIDSIFAQAYDPTEVVVIDDGSDDDSAAIIRSYGKRVVYARQDNQGPPAARNHGLNLVTGDIIGFLDADDIWCPGKLAIQLGILRDCPDVDAALGKTQLMTRDPAYEGFRHFIPYQTAQFFPSLAAHLFRRSVFERTGSLNCEQRHGDDIDFLARAKEAGIRIRQHGETVLEYRRHDRNITNDVELDRKFYIAAIKRAMDRKRGAQAA